VIGGSILFGTAWLPTAITGSFAGTWAAIIPVAGPWVIAGQTGQGSQFHDVGAVGAFWLVFDGLQQAAGLSMLIAGAAAKEQILLRNDVNEASRWWLPVPMQLGPRGAGLGFVGAL
jgi:hypothetical protein